MDGILPLKIQLMSLRMESLEFLSSLVELNLGSLGFSNFFLKLVSFSRYFNSKLFNLES